MNAFIHRAKILLSSAQCAGIIGLPFQGISANYRAITMREARDADHRSTIGGSKLFGGKSPAESTYLRIVYLLSSTVSPVQTDPRNFRVTASP